MTEVPHLLLRWEPFVGDLLDRTAKFPKAIRFTFAQRIDNTALNVLEQLVRARFGTGRLRAAALAEADLQIAQLRVLLRLAHARQMLDHRSYEHVSRELDDCGRMLGGWRKQAAGDAT